MYEALHGLHRFFHENPEWVVASIWGFSAAVQALPTPREGGSLFYGWLFNFSHVVAGNIGLIGKKRLA